MANGEWDERGYGPTPVFLSSLFTVLISPFRHSPFTIRLSLHRAGRPPTPCSIRLTVRRETMPVMAETNAATAMTLA
jgi:hypothetical protein